MTLLLAWGFGKMSRATAVLAIFYYAIPQVMVYADGHTRPNFVIMAIFLLAYVNGFRGALFYHRLIGSRARWVRIFGAGAASVILVVSVYAVAIIAGYYNLPEDPTRDLVLGMSLFGAILLPWLVVPHLFGAFVSVARNG